MKKTRDQGAEEEVFLTQEAAEQLKNARTMEEYLRIAEENGIDWNELSDEWLDAIISGDISDLLWQQERRRRRAGKAKHENGI